MGSKQDLDFLVSNTTLDEYSIQEWYEGFLRDCPSGELSSVQFVNMYSKIFPQREFREFMLALHVTSNGTPEEKLGWAFRMYDVDGNGTIEFTEMRRVVGAVYEMLGSDSGDVGKAQELFSKMDQNSDGFVSQEEFV